MVFGHDDDQCPKRVVADSGKQNSKANNEFVNVPRKAFRGLHVGGPEFRLTDPTKQFYKPVAKKDTTSTIGTKKGSQVVSHMTLTSNPFDSLNSVESDDILGSNWGNTTKADTEVTKPSLVGTSSNTVNKVGKSTVIDEESESDVEHDHDGIG
ncbi:hypothetical protein Tco_1510885 [Tanacetum coccineum]